MRRLIFPFIVTMAFAAPPSNPIEQELRARDQALLDAIASGNVSGWDAALAPGAMYVDENGTIIPRAEFLAQVKPLPAGTSGKITISAYTMHLSGDVASVVHTDDEQEQYHGQHLTAQYLTTETWQRQNGTWKLLLVHTFSVLKEPKAVNLRAQKLDAYAGRYAAAPDLVYTIRREGDHLTGQQNQNKSIALKVEIRDVLFASGQLRSRKIFERDAAGKITGFVDRREGNDLSWKRLQ
jgi:Domain of unknown function (DUF4440)